MLEDGGEFVFRRSYLVYRNLDAACGFLNYLFSFQFDNILQKNRFAPLPALSMSKGPSTLLSGGFLYNL